jgi:Restriction endonuclease
MNPSNLKGKLLEYAVLNIESLIFNSPFRKDETAANIRIIPNYTKITGYEIDLYVIVERDKNLDSTFIFECKNWVAKIDRKEITDFSEKITKSAAQKGFFIAQEFTSGAIARANDDPRLELVYWKPNLEFLSIIPTIDFYDANNVKIVIKHEIIKENIFSINERGSYFSYRCQNDSNVDVLIEITTVPISNKLAPNEFTQLAANNKALSIRGADQQYRITNRSVTPIRIEIHGAMLLSEFLTLHNLNN